MSEMNPSIFRSACFTTIASNTLVHIETSLIGYICYQCLNNMVVYMSRTVTIFLSKFICIWAEIEIVQLYLNLVSISTSNKIESQSSLFSTDCCVLFSRYLYHARQGILTILGRSQQHTTPVGNHLCEPDFSGKIRSSY